MGAGTGLLRRARERFREEWEMNEEDDPTNEDFARIVLGRTRSTVHRWETGRTKRIPKNAIAMLRAYLGLERA